jgi:GNAT superfamily N-acetyltransferase
VTEFRELVTDEDFRAAFPVMHELRDQLDEADYLDLVAEMRPRGYRLIAAEVDGRIVALAGIGVGVNFYYRRYLWVYDLITSEAERSKGYGLALMEHLEALARSEGCDTLALASALHRTDAHRFYMDKIGMEKPSYTFSKTLG